MGCGRVGKAGSVLLRECQGIVWAGAWVGFSAGGLVSAVVMVTASCFRVACSGWGGVWCGVVWEGSALGVGGESAWVSLWFLEWAVGLLLR